MTPGIGSSGADSAARQAAVSSRPQVQTRRVSVKLGPLGITYSTDQVLWGDDAEASPRPTSAPGASASSSVPPGSSAAGNPTAMSSPSSTANPSASTIFSASASPFAAPGQAEAPLAPSARIASQGRRSDAESGGDLNGGQDGGQASPLSLAGGFDAALDRAWNVLAAGIAATQTYDRSGRLGASGRGAGAAQGAGGAGTAEPDRAGPGQAEFEQGGPERISREAQAARTLAPWPQGGEAQQQAGADRGATGARLRRAVAAYLACAGGFAAPQPMLRVTA